MDSLYEWFVNEVPDLLPQSPMAKAIRYTIKRWIGLTQFLNKPYLLPDNNLVENAIRPLALGRKNYLFAGSHDGAHRAAIFYTLFGTAKINDIDPYAWLADVLTRIMTHPINRIDELLPVSGYRFS